MNNEEIIEVNKNNFTPEEQEVIDTIVDFQEAMINKDEDALNNIINDNYTLTHMSGKKQTKQEYINEIMDNTLNYYKSVLNIKDISINNNEATVHFDNTLTAKVYGISGTWTLNSTLLLKKTDDEWCLYNWNN